MIANGEAECKSFSSVKVSALRLFDERVRPKRPRLHYAFSSSWFQQLSCRYVNYETLGDLSKFRISVHSMQLVQRNDSDGWNTCT